MATQTTNRGAVVAPAPLADRPAFLTPRGQAVAAVIGLQRLLVDLSDEDLAYVMPLVAELLGLDG